MRVAALGDAHLGRSYLPFTTPEGVNQRERDVLQQRRDEGFFGDVGRGAAGELAGGDRLEQGGAPQGAALVGG